MILLIGGYLFVLPNVGNIYSYNFNWFSENSISIVFAQTSASTMDNMNKTKLVYHLSSDEPWRATIALLDSQTMLKMGYNVTLMLSIEGVQLGVKNPHQYLGLQPLIKNVSDFISKGGQVIICETCLKIAGYDNTDIINGSIIGDPKIMANLLNQTTVVDY
ncbi:DsrE family protein [Candidatus Nitrosocosmicus franklandus]|uniref:DsrE family protein n=1 Tax=Candidatus Nitrosocosmicus franklandianus TaxID=1798806 RepID=UPI001558E788|nr:DsrE family protein [Candidatus Nitrosocosmicus franklandus]